MKLPIPNTRAGWLAGVALVVSLFMVYYESLYKEIYKFYDNQYAQVSISGIITCEEPSITAQSNYCDLCVSDDALTDAGADQTSAYLNQNKQVVCKEQKWSLVMKIPKFTSYVTPGWIYGRLKNEGVDKQDADLSINFTNESINLLPAMYNENTFVRVIRMEQIPSGGTVYWRTEFGSNVIENQQKCNNDLKDAFLLNGQKIDTSGNINMVCPGNEIGRSLSRSATEGLLLPPWSNAFIPALALFLCSIFEPKVNTDDSKKSEGFWKVVWGSLKTYGLALGTSFVLIFFFRRWILFNSSHPVQPPVLRSESFLLQTLLYIATITILVLLIVPLSQKIWSKETVANKFNKAKVSGRKKIDEIKSRFQKYRHPKS